MEFTELSALQREIATLLEYHVYSLDQYHLKDSGGFRHKFEDKKKTFSKASTATCVLSLVSTGQWKQGPWYKDTEQLIVEMSTRENWSSAGLEEGNPFTVAFMLEAVTTLSEEVNDITLSEATIQGVEEAEKILYEALMSNDESVEGSACLKGYPPTTYLTQLVVRVLKRRNKLTDEAREATKHWAWRQIDHELALKFSGSQTADALALAYAVILIPLCSNPSEATPDQNQILRKAIDTVFEAQLTDGSWPQSRPLFHYPAVGNAYCFEYEMLTQFLQQQELIEHILRHLPKLSRSTMKLKETAFRFKDRGLGWASGHHPQLEGPESWSSASVYHFLHELDRTLAEAIRRSVFDYIGAEYTPPQKPQSSSVDFGSNLLDSDIFIDGKEESLIKILSNSFIHPVAKHTNLVEQGRSLPRNVPISAILFGPPGTAKTRLAKEIADFLSWPLLTIDPSHLVRHGLDKVQAETNTVFSMLAALERVVVLLDEFDEMVRERTAEQSEVVSRFLTTAMLPKLALINDRRRIIFIVATNHIDQFDFAIRRPGRFDILLQVMPPSTKAKLAYTSWGKTFVDLKDKYRFEISKVPEIEKQLSKLTFAEFEQLAKQLRGAQNEHHAKNLIQSAYDHCTLVQKVKGEQERPWIDICQEQTNYIRIPFSD